MKKIYSIVLMAAALLIGTNVNAEVKPTDVAKIGDNGYATLAEAFGAAVNGDVITLLKSVDVDNTIVLMKEKNCKITLDLNGFNITGQMSNEGVAQAKHVYYSYKAIFALFRGTFEIKGKGQITQGNVYKNTYKNGAITKKTLSNSAVVIVFGAGFNNDTQDPMNDATMYGNWSNLIIGDGTVDENGDPITILKANSSNLSAGVEIYPFGTGYVTLATKIDGTNTLQSLCDANGIDYTNVKGSKKAAYGATITVKKGGYVYGDKYGLQISGNINVTDGNLPIISVEEEAEVEANATSSKSAGVYAAGAGVSNINGEVHGSTGVYVKSGTVNVGDGAFIHSDNETRDNPDGKKSGIDAGGSAIVYESNSAYVGDISINVTGGTIGSKDNGGFAIEGYNSKDTGEAQELENLNIKGGLIVAGKSGSLETTVLQDALAQGATLVVDGATITSSDVDLSNLNDLLTLAGATTLIAPTVDPDGNIAYTMTQAPKGTTVMTNEDLNTTTKKYIELSGDAQTISKDIVELEYLALKDNADGDHSSIIIPAGKELRVGSIVMNEYAVIDVQLGGKLIITNKEGLVANKTSNIKIAAKEGQMGIFMLSPKAEANKNPSATVTLETKAHAIDAATDQFAYQRIGVPAAKGMKASEISYSPASANIALKYWDADKQDWAWVPSLATVLEPFRGYSLTNLATAEGTKYSFPCQLMGNTDANLLLKGKWTSFANSYMANVDLFALLADILAADAGASASVYVYDAAGEGGNHWPVIDYGDLEEWKAGHIDAPLFTALEPMQGFIFRNIDETIDANAVISYENDVWNPVFAPAAIAARRGAKANNVTRVKITITGENGQASTMTLRQGEDFSAAFDNGYDAHAMIGLNPVTIFANTEMGEMASVASNNVEGTTLSIASQEESNFTMTFSNLNGEQLAIRDNLTGSVINMVEGAEYRFAVAENSSADRFEIVAIHNAPTAVETVANIEGVKAVYTVLGQYVGTTDNWNVLPAGIYVVDGVKMVK